MYNHSDTSDTGAKAQFLVELEFALAVDTACAERWFSLMANLKDKKRNRMDDGLLNKLMFICLHAPKDILALKTIVNDIRWIGSSAAVVLANEAGDSLPHMGCQCCGIHCVCMAPAQLSMASREAEQL